MAGRSPMFAELDSQVLVPAGPFLFGDDEEMRYLDPFRIDTYPVTVARYARFVTETGHAPPRDWDGREGPAATRNHPVSGVSFFDALAFARWAGRRIPSEEQWEKAARGTDGRAYPWGDRFSVRNLNSRAAKKHGTTPVDAYPDGRSPFGAMDMCGNLWEWTDTWYDMSFDLKVLKGGCHTLTKEHAAAFHRHYNDPSFANNLTGFRTILPL